MKDFVICTDGGCDLSADVISAIGVKKFELSFRFDGDKDYAKADRMSTEHFYKRMREGGVAKTSAVNSEEFYRGFESIFKSGKDILYIGLSSGISTTYNSARVAAQRLSSAYGERRALLVDSRSASSGLGLTVYLTAKHKAAGGSLSECRDLAAELSSTVCHLFTVEDLCYLRRGGRISAARAIIGNALGIKPILHMSLDGHLVDIGRARGRRGSVEELARLYGEYSENRGGNEIFISHADSDADAAYLSRRLAERYGASVKGIFDIGPAIGAHSGPGTLALFFKGRKGLK